MEKNEKLYRRHKIKISISDIEKLFIGIKKNLKLKKK